MDTADAIMSQVVRLLIAGGAPIWLVLAVALVFAVMLVLAPKVAKLPGGGPVRQPGEPNWEDASPGTPIPQADPDHPGGDCK